MPPRSLQQRVGLALRARREALGISQEKFADEIGVHRTYWGAVERGKQNLTLTSIERFAGFFNVRVASLFADADALLDE